MNPSSSTTPLTQVVPWSVQSSPRTIVIGDSIESDGRFLLHTLASQVLEKKAGRVLWLSSGPVTTKLIANALKKIGCDAASRYSSSSNTTDTEASPLSIRCLTAEIGKKVEEDVENLNMELFIKQIYREVKEWLHLQQSSSSALDKPVPWIILDDVSALGALVGERLAYGLIISINALATHSQTPFGFALRCSHDLQELQDSLPGAANHGVEKPVAAPLWVGAGGQSRRHVETVPWEASLVEIADGLVDVLPLASGYTREAHGRLLFTAASAGRGWGGEGDKRTAKDEVTLVFNYCLTDSKVQAIQIRKSV